MKWEIIKKFSVKNMNCFRYQDVIGEFPDKDRSHLSKVLSSMVSMGMLMKLHRDLYFIIPLSADLETYSPDSRIVAKCIIKGKGYYLAYSSAMINSGSSSSVNLVNSTRYPNDKDRRSCRIRLISMFALAKYTLTD